VHTTPALGQERAAEMLVTRQTVDPRERTTGIAESSAGSSLVVVQGSNRGDIEWSLDLNMCNHPHGCAFRNGKDSCYASSLCFADSRG
jgi:hypothetical protein